MTKIDAILASRMLNISSWIAGFVVPAALIVAGPLLFQTIEGGWILVLPLAAGFSGGLILREWWSVFTAPVVVIGVWLLLGVLQGEGDNSSSGLEVSGAGAIIALLAIFIVIPAMVGAGLGMAVGVRIFGWRDK